MIFSESQEKIWKAKIKNSSERTKERLGRIYGAEQEIDGLFEEYNFTYNEAKQVLSDVEIGINGMGARFAGETPLKEMLPRD
jgi:hypothetical protein